MFKYFLSLYFLVFISITVLFAQKNPSFEEVISVSRITNVELSPDGLQMVYEVSSADWEKNTYDTELWIIKGEVAHYQLTNNKEGSSSNAKWSPTGEWIAFLANDGKHTQINVISVWSGAIYQLSDIDGSVIDFEWSPDETKIAYTRAADNSKENKKREEKYGAFAVEDSAYAQRELWLLDFDQTQFGSYPLPEVLEDSIFKSKSKGKKLLEEAEFSIRNFLWSPDGKKLAFTHQPNPLINSFLKSDIAIYDFSTEDYTTVVENSSADFLAAWSPDSKKILYETSLDDAVSNFFTNSKYFIINTDGTENEQVASSFDENLGQFHWNDQGIFATAWQKTERQLIFINPENGKVEVKQTGLSVIRDVSISKSGSKMVLLGSELNALSEVYEISYPSLDDLEQRTTAYAQMANWATSDSEVISWKSKDGTTIEGVLHKPKDYDPNKKYPLLVAIHGGPTSISYPQPIASYVYPIVQWLNKGALVLQPNYRGSAGYGEKFRSLNVRNLGVGDAWDVLSGVDYLEKEGMIDTDKMGVMDWSQGGYISAFLATNTDRFKAVSVGAGISNWVTYYVNTDIHPFTRQYLKATPWQDMKIYEKTSPMTNIKEASTPTLIQHGEFDKRVPPANAFELYQGLQDVGVPTKLVIYKGFGHGITKPKERLAAVWHNWQWFGKYVWGEDIEMPE